jgi:hypothetical protein
MAYGTTAITKTNLNEAKIRSATEDPCHELSNAASDFSKASLNGDRFIQSKWSLERSPYFLLIQVIFLGQIIYRKKYFHAIKSKV